MSRSATYDHENKVWRYNDTNEVVPDSELESTAPLGEDCDE